MNVTRLPTPGRSEATSYIKTAVLIVLAAIVLAFVVTSVPQLAGADESYVVLSDSMSPSIKAGAVVMVSEVPTSTIRSGDVITFHRGDDGSTPPVTHRVVDVWNEDGSRSFVTKGDANEEPDPSPVPTRAVVGKVSFHIPFIGYLVSFARTRVGLLTLVIGPAVVLVTLDLRDLWRAAKGDSEGGTSTGGDEP